MSDNSHQGASPAASDGVDLSQFFQVFFEEAGENLSGMETMLLALDIDNPVEEDLHAIFRCAHSIKGGAATFGFQDIAELTHELETLLDKLRKHELKPTREMIDLMLTAGDALKAQLARHGGSGEGNVVDTTELVEELRMLAAGNMGDAKPKAQVRALDIVIGPLTNPATADNLFELFKEIPDMGIIVARDDGKADAGNKRHFHVETTWKDDELLDLFSFHVAKECIAIQPAASIAAKNDDAGFGLFDDDAPAATPQGQLTPQAEVAVAAQKAEANKPEARAQAAQSESATLRVNVEKVDQLINLVGELVITQAMLSQQGRALDPVHHQTMLTGLSGLERSTRSLQDAVMSIRMIPMAVVFNRFPRMLRDLAAKLGKQVELKTSGEATELDKGLIEKITDPLTHLIRNSVDHGIEMPDKRIESNKPAAGTIFLSASHQGGSIVIDVRDDGAGLNRERILAKARQQGIEVSDSMTDQEVWQLIWAPGFSTAEKVTDVSGRGVGMDVVKKNIAALGGTVELDSAEGHGTRVSVRLPLTLAIMDGMSVAVNGEIFIIPLASVVESLQVREGMLRTVVGQGRVVEVRSEYLPVVSLHDVLNASHTRADDSTPLLVIVESEGAKTALMVDELVGQHQVVVKNLETNYRKVAGVSGATIMGDGRVALILDVMHVVGTANSRMSNSPANSLKH
jgi:two-component system chemotaxis sensor kinase CheA